MTDPAPRPRTVARWRVLALLAAAALLAGCELRRATEVTAVERLTGGGFRVTTNAGELTARRLVNAAGLRSDEVDRMLGFERFTVTPRRGELIVLDKLARPLVRHVRGLSSGP